MTCTVRELLGRNDAMVALQNLSRSNETAFHRAELEDRLVATGIANVRAVLDDMIATGIVVGYGPRLGISMLGHKARLLAEAMDGADIEETFRRLRQLSGAPPLYDLVREGMTSLFIRSLIERPGFRRLFFCSPWINPPEKDVARLKYALIRQMEAQDDTPEIIVIVRPTDMAPPGTEGGLQAFVDLGAQVFVNPRIHSKLYIREPDRRGGLPMAIVGSQNLTRGHSLELGIRINGDSALIDQLVRYFLEIASRSTEQAA